MRAGPLRERVTIQSKIVARDSFNAEVITWVEVATVWMAVEPLSGREYIAARQAQSEVTTRFRCRYRADVTSAMRLVWRTVPYSIIEVIPDVQRSALEILAYAEAV